ncbi:MAG: uroporphyrinogen-III synthase [Sphingobium sp.]
MTRLVLLRPQPGADHSAARAKDAGFDVISCPLFTVHPLAWLAPDPALFDAIMLTSANALRHGGSQLGQYIKLPAFAVGAATAQTAQLAGFVNVHAGGENAQQLIADMIGAGHRQVLHIAGRDVRPVDAGSLHLTRVSVYESGEASSAQELNAHLQRGDVLLVHSARAAQRLASLVLPEARSALNLVAISDIALAAAGPGWNRARAAFTPDDGAMLAIAEQICQ